MAKLGIYLGFFVLVAVSSVASGGWCTATRVRRYLARITYRNPCPYRGNYISYRTVWRTRLESYRLCCDGWTGCYCNIPICRTPCGPNQKCVLPNQCECSSLRFVPVAGGRQCSLRTCTTETNCYPGSCQPSGQCACSSGFEGNNCQTVSDTARYRKCKVTLVGKDSSGQTVNNMIDGECSEDEIIRNVTVKTAFSKVKTIDRMGLDWEGYYFEPRDLPKYAPYIAFSRPGIIYSSTNLNLQGTLRQYPCYNGRRNNSASLTTMCTESQGVFRPVPHNSTQTISLYTEIGGLKQYKAEDDQGQYENQIFRGPVASVVLEITFDSEAPVHCMVDPRYTCMSEGNIPDPEPIFAGIDATSDPDITFYWAGWYDIPSQIDTYAYSFWKLQYVNGTLVPYGPPDIRGVWEPGTEYPSITASKPCLISAVLNVSDVAGNMRRAETLVLYAPDSSLEADESKPIMVQGAAGGGRWINSLEIDSVTLLYSGHFKNKVFEEHKLLAPVLQQPAIDVAYRDTYGNMTSAGLGPTEGIKSVRFIYQDRSSNKRRKRQAGLPSGSTSPTDLQNKQVTIPFEPTTDGDTIEVNLTVTDVMANEVNETVKVGVDTSPPIVEDTSARFTGNSNKQIGGLEHFTSSFVTRAYDPHSGVTGAVWRASQPGNVVDGKYNIPPVSPSQCTLLGANCICTPMGDCYNANAEVLLDNCELAKLDQSINFDLEVNFINNASLAATKVTRQITPYKIQGPGQYPNVAEPLAEPNSPTSVDVTWRLPHTCETLARIKLEYQQRSTSVQSVILSREAENFTLAELHAQREGSVTIILVYANGETAKISRTFVTPATALAITGAQIAGTAIGLIVLILILIILILLLLMWIYRKKNVEDKPALLVALEDKMETYGVLKVYRERLYQDSPYYKANVPYPSKKTMVGDQVYDEVQIYQKMDLPAAGNTFESKYDISDIVLGSGSLCVIKRANLRDSKGSKAVAAKMLKGGKGEKGKLLLEAKINYLARVPNHENLVNYVHADKAVPVLFLDLCGLGTLLDWVKNLNNQMSTEDNNKLLGFSQDVAAGLKHLHDNKIVHRRLAAHNILLASGTDRPTAKITGFGPLASDHDHTNKKIPARWMAPELLGNPRPGEQRPYTSHSDMWTWGVTLWEVFSFGQKPYDDIPIENLKRRLTDGELLPQPQYCADTMYEQLMRPCWKLNPQDRATADHIYAKLDTFVNGGHDNDGYYGADETENADDDTLLENALNRQRTYANNPNQPNYDDPPSSYNQN